MPIHEYQSPKEGAQPPNSEKDNNLNNYKWTHVLSIHKRKYVLSLCRHLVISRNWKTSATKIFAILDMRNNLQILLYTLHLHADESE